MSAIILLILRIGLAIALYAFLVWVFFTVWRDIRSQESHLADSLTIPIRLSFQIGDENKDLRLAKREIILGRDPGCDCLLNDITISTRHASLTFNHQQWWLEDLGSTNGTLLNQEPISSAMVVTSGDQITCGKISISIFIENHAS